MMVLEYKSETTLRVRLILLLTVPFSASIGMLSISFFGLFSREAYDLVAPILGGDMTRLGDFMGYLAILALTVVVSSTLIIGALYESLVKRDYDVEIDPDRRTVNVHFLRALPWHRSSSSSYPFDDIKSVELRYDDEGNEIRILLPDRKFTLKLTQEYSRRVAEKKLRQLKEMGLPAR